MKNIIDSVLQELEEYQPKDYVTNHYGRHQDLRTDRANAIRRHNLRLYLNLMQDRKPKMLWIGEAPGYPGCLISGVPFTSEYILVNGENSLLENNSGGLKSGYDLFGHDKGYNPIHEEGRYKKEATASMIWQKVALLDNYPLLRNAFPFHPHKQGNENSNRPPNKHELEMGEIFIQDLRKFYKIEKLAAIGRTAEKCLKKLNLIPTYIPHPSYGRKILFDKGIDEFTADINQFD